MQEYVLRSQLWDKKESVFVVGTIKTKIRYFSSCLSYIWRFPNFLKLLTVNKTKKDLRGVWFTSLGMKV